jgi:glycosyl transferase family 92
MASQDRNGKSYLSLCAIYRDEARYVREWLEFHRLVGVERFFLYDNRSSDAHREVLAPYIEDGIVELTDWPAFPAQGKAYRHCLQQHWDGSRWIGFIDLDEFLYSPTGRPLPELLADFEQFPGVAVNRASYGSSGHETAAEGLVIESYTRRAHDQADVNKFVKSIVDPHRAVGCWADQNPHCFLYSEGFAVNELKRPIDKFPYGRSEPISFSLFRINHYWTKSEQEWRAKAAIPMASNGRLRAPEIGEDLNAIEDDSMAGYVPALREALERMEARSPSAELLEAGVEGGAGQ